MAKGQYVQLSFHQYLDADTQSVIIRLTPPDIACHRNYFYQKCFTQDGQYLLFAGSFDGNRNYYLLDLNAQQAIQLTEGEGDNTFGGFLSPDDRYLYYVKSGRELRRVDLKTLDEKVIYTVADDWVGYGTWVANSDCSKMVAIEIAKTDWEPLTDWQKFQAFYHKNPHCRLIRIDLNSGERAVVLDQKQWLGHPIYRPHDDNTIAFCHEGPHDLVDARMWFINEDGSNMRCAKVHQPGESCTHEFWVPDGSAMIYVSYLKGQSTREIHRIDPITLQDQLIMEMPPCSHLMSNDDGSLLIGDGANAPVDIKDDKGYHIENDPYLYLFNTASGTYDKLATHGTSWQVFEGDRQITHPHPSFTPDDKYILFTSDRDGKPALYLAAIPSVELND